VEDLPIHAPFLAPTIQPFKERFFHSASKLLKPFEIIGNTIVTVMTKKLLSYNRPYLCDLLLATDFSDPLLECYDLHPKFLPRCPSLHPEVALPASTYIVREAQIFKDATPSPKFPGTEFYNSRLAWLQFQSVGFHPSFYSLPKSLRFPLFLKANNKIVAVPDQLSLPSATHPILSLKPFVQYIVKIHIR
jgi:hypothetical protein